MVDRHIEKMIATLKEKASHETESLTKMLSDCKQQLENAKAMEKREEKLRQSRDDASTIQHLQKLNDEICIPVTHRMQIETLHLSQRKRKSSLCSSHLNLTSWTTVSPF
jgi:serine phosphatase RsbU (regulator of sigma subunit)